MNQDIVIDFRKVTVHVGGKEVLLTPKEFDILTALRRVDGAMLTRKALVSRVWRDNSVGVDARSVDQHVCRLRRKIGPQRIVSVRARGYRLA